MKKICIVSTCRSDFGIISNIVKKIQFEKNIKSSFLIYDIHKNQKLGNSIDEIKAQNIKVDFIVKPSVKSFTNKELNLSYRLGSTIFEVSKILNKIKPDIVILYGDRIELMSFALASVLQKIPVGHINGGELTYGAYDELVRHSLTKISNYHFVASQKNKKILIQMGEEKKNIFNIGHPVYENIKNINLLNKLKLEKKLSFRFKKKNALVSYHSVTLMKDYGIQELKTLLSCLEKKKEIQFFLSYPNYDVGHEEIIKLLEKYSKKNKHFILRKTFGHRMYLSMLKNVDFIIGNSSSGILEAPIFKTASINIGNRQKGRTRTSSILDCNSKHKEICKSIDSVYQVNFLTKLKKTKLQYSYKDSADIMIKKLKKIIKEPKVEKIFQFRNL